MKLWDSHKSYYNHCVTWFLFLFNLNRTVAVTYFEPAHARKVFPCFDEPLFKSSFNISIIHDPEPYYALSNMPRDRCVVREDGLVETHFAPSVNMSSYLVAFAVVDFKYKESKTDSGVLVSCLVASKVFIWLVWQRIKLSIAAHKIFVIYGQITRCKNVPLLEKMN